MKLFSGLTLSAGCLLFLTTAAAHRDPGEERLFCSSATRVALSSVDERFQLGRKEMVEEIREAARLWSDAIGQPVAVYDEEEGIPIHFIYEDQQELTGEESVLKERIALAGEQDV